MEDKKEFEPLENDWSSMRVAPATKFGTVIKAGDPATKDRVTTYQPISLSNHRSGTQVELLREQDAVTAIRFRCECGCETTVELVVE